jgi:hypothetical protein
MSKDAQDYLNAAKRVEKRMLTGQFGSTGIDFSETPDASPQNKLDVTKTANTSENPMMKAVLNGFDTGNQGAAIQGLMNGVGTGGSIIATNAQAADNGMGGSAGKEDPEKKKRDEFDALLRLQAQLAQRLADIDHEIAGLRVKIAANEEAISKLDVEKAGILAVDAKLQAHLDGKAPLKVGADGKMEDPQVEAAFQALEARMGKKIDRNDPNAVNEAAKLLLALDHDRLNKIEEERKKREGENDDYRTRIGDLNTERTKVDAANQHAKDAIKSGNEAEVEAAFKEGKEARQLEQKNTSAKETNDFDDLNALNDLGDEGNSKIALNTSAASAVDQKTDDVRIRGNFNDQAQPLEKLEVAAAVLDKNLAAKPV